MRRQREYLNTVFRHDPKYISMMYMKHDYVFPVCYDALVEAKGHGVPGSQVTNVELHPDLPMSLGRWWSEYRPAQRPLSDSESEILWRRAERVIQKGSNLFSGGGERWDVSWRNGGHFGFKTFQHEVGGLRGDLMGGRIASPRNDNEDRKQMVSKLNDILVASVVEWARRWDELDLHLVWAKDAARLIYEHVVRWSGSWKTLRIVAGGLGGKRHFSSGTLNGMLRTFFEDGYVSEAWTPSQDDMVFVEEVRYMMRAKKFSVKFYSRETAVFLEK